MQTEQTSYMVMLWAMKVIAIVLILVMIAKKHNETGVEDRFFKSQPWTLEDAYKVLFLPLVLIYAISVISWTILQTNDPWFHLFLRALWYTATFGGYFLFFHKLYRPSWSTFGLDKSTFLITAVRHVNLAAALILLGPWLAEEANVAWDPTDGSHEGFALWKAVSLIRTVLIAPVFEEFLFRGLLFAPVARKFGVWKAMALLALVFDLCHLHWGIEAIPLYLVCFLLYLGYYKCRSLWVPIVWHVSMNFSKSKPALADLLEGLIDSAALDWFLLCGVLLGLIVMNTWRFMYFRKHGPPRDFLTTMQLRGNLEELGVLIHAIDPGSVSEQAGMRKGDVITEYNGARWLTTQRLAERIAAARNQMKDIPAVFVRDGMEHAVNLRPGALGATVSDVTISPAPGVSDSDRGRTLN
jgi:membrane protease YdiL (CAAX protease family)